MKQLPDDKIADAIIKAFERNETVSSAASLLSTLLAPERAERERELALHKKVIEEMCETETKCEKHLDSVGSWPGDSNGVRGVPERVEEICAKLQKAKELVGKCEKCFSEMIPFDVKDKVARDNVLAAIAQWRKSHD